MNHRLLHYLSWIDHLVSVVTENSIFSSLFKLIMTIIRQPHDPVGPKCVMSEILYILLSGGCQDCATLSFRATLGMCGITTGNFPDVGATSLVALGNDFVLIVAVQSWKSDKEYIHYFVHWPQSNILKTIKKKVVPKSKL